MFGRRRQHEGRSISLKKNKKCREKGLYAILTHFTTLPGVALIIVGCELTFEMTAVYQVNTWNTFIAVEPKVQTASTITVMVYWHSNIANI